MRLYSTNLKSEEVSFESALLRGQAPDRGLYMPVSIPSISEDELESLKDLEYHEIAYIIANKYLHDEVDEASLKRIVEDAYNYPVPLEKVNEDTQIMRLDNGPTASFKDFAARMMARLMQYFMKKNEKEILILTATSGDTGSAVAQAFYGLDNIKVVVLFPEKEVSDRQRKQMTTLGKNITAIAVDGKFDDCQAMVKQAFSDEDLERMNISSANSINFGRLLPQSIYYFYAYSRINQPLLFSVPSGNFGDLMGGLLAKNMGVPVKKFIVAVNENDEFPSFMDSGSYEKIVPSKNCLSNAMNVGHPSNLARLFALYKGHMDEKGFIHKMPEVEKIKEDMFAVSVSDQETKETIKKYYDEFQTIVEPHGAVGLKGLESYRESSKDSTIAVCLETADPAKFPDQIKELLGIDPVIPESLKKLDELEECMEKLDADYQSLKEFLITRIRVD